MSLSGQVPSFSVAHLGIICLGCIHATTDNPVGEAGRSPQRLGDESFAVADCNWVITDVAGVIAGWTDDKGAVKIE